MQSSPCSVVAGSVGSAAFPLLAPATGNPSYSFAGIPTAGLYLSGGQLRLDSALNYPGATVPMYISGGWSSSANTSGGSIIIAAGAGSATNANGGTLSLSAGVGAGTGLPGPLLLGSWPQQVSGLGRAALGGDYTNATVTFSNTVLSSNLYSGRQYTFRVALYVSDSTAADGAKLDFNGGSAAASDFIVTCVLTNAVGAVLTQANAVSTALGTTINIAALTDTAQHTYLCSGTVVASTTGTFIVRGAQNAHTTGTLTFRKGSHMWLEDTP